MEVAAVRRYDFECEMCGERFDVERPTAEAGAPAACPFCGEPARRVFTAPRFLFKGDPTENRPVWHNHGAFGHAHAPRRGHHPPGIDE
ncbi:MAG TPA: zinc ribbon domain-containing protein [Thermomicrobiales bacterium]|nr:zinc ribbon domain-containing protein [Thermomicrobiales bacterium]